MAAAAALMERGVRVELLEARRQAGGRAASFREPATGELVDHCQHVSMGCCTNLADLCQRAGLADLFRRDRTLHFIGPDGKVSAVTASRWLPAPFHLVAASGKLSYLNKAEWIGISKALQDLANSHNLSGLDAVSMADWLRAHEQSANAIDWFWKVILVSALGDALERCSTLLAREVFVRGFMNHRAGYELLVPTEPLAELFGRRLPAWLASQGVSVRNDSPVARVLWNAGRAAGVELYDGQTAPCDAAIVAVPWFRLAGLLGDDAPAALGSLRDIADWEAAPIAGAHLWFDRPITDLPHAVLVGRLSQWLFRPDALARDGQAEVDGHYYQVVISGARELAELPREETIDRIVAELREAFPAARAARLLRWRLVVDPQAVFSPTPGQAARRPSQETAVDNFFLAGDWTNTGWPATMEGAVRSGRHAAEALLASLGRPERLVTPNLPRGRITRWILRPER
jgi:squalene-associated FAD-dependent desaturase